MIEDVGLRRIVVTGFHERALYQVLDLLDLRCARCDEGLLHACEERLQRGRVAGNGVCRLGECFAHGAGDFLSVVGLDAAVSLGYLHVIPDLRRGRRMCVSWATGGALGAHASPSLGWLVGQPHRWKYMLSD